MSLRLLRTRPLLSALIALTMTGATLTSWTGPAVADDPVSASISAGSLHWGIKTSWRTYAGQPVRADGGAVIESDGTFSFPLSGGTFDASTGTTEVQFSGTLQWQGHNYLAERDILGPPPAGWEGSLDIYVMDITFSDPSITIGPDGSTVSVHAWSRDTDTWQITDFGRVPLVNLGTSSAVPSTEGGTTQWTDLPAFLTAAGVAAFGGFYAPGVAVDPVSFEYEGPGGVPVVEENWTPPNTMSVSEVASATYGTYQTAPTTWWTDAGTGLAHTYTLASKDDGFVYEFTPFSLVDMAPAGAAFDVPLGEIGGMLSPAFADAEHGRLYYPSVGGSRTIDSFVEWDDENDRYVRGTLDAPFTVKGSATSMLWDPAHERAITIELRVPSGVGRTDYERHEWYLNAYTRQADGSFVERSLPLPNGPAGWNRRWYLSSFANASAAIAPDGSIILSRQNAGASAPVESLLAQRIVITGNDAVVSEIPGSSLATATGTARFTAVYAGAQSDIYLVAPSSVATGRTHALELAVDGETVGLGQPVDLGEQGVSNAFAVDLDGTLWALSPFTQTLTAVTGDRVAFQGYFSTINTKHAALVAAPDGSIYATANDGRPVDVSPPWKFGYVRFVESWSPSIIEAPADATATAGQRLDLSVSVSGEPTPSLQWQRRDPGTLRFQDLAGANSATLGIDASADLNGVEYRAVATNAAGSIASDPATLTVLFAPTIAQHPANTAVQPGAEATFQLLASGSPEPTIEWQQHRGGEWVAVSADSTVVEGGNLRVINAQASAQFRAKVSNSQGTVYSTVASLTVQLPQGGEGGSITGLPNSIGARTTVTPGVDLPLAGNTAVTGTGFVQGTNEAGAYVLFGYATKLPTAGGTLGAGYDYLPGQDNQRFVAWPTSETAGSANGVFTDGGGFTIEGLVVSSSFTGASGSPVECLDNSVQCGVITIGAHGGRDANLETFTPVYFTGQSPNVTTKAPALSSSPVSVSVVENTAASFSAGATGWPIPTVQWQSALPGAGDWVDIPDATASTYRVTAVPLSASGTQYRAVFTNSEGTVTTEAATLTVTRAPAPVATTAGSLTWGVKASFRNYIVGTIARGSIGLSGGASGSGGAFRFEQSSADWNVDAGVGSAEYRGAVRFSGHSGVLDLTLSNPAIQVNSASSATLLVSANGSRVAIGNVNLAGAARSEVTGGVAYTNAPVSLTAAGVSVFSYGSSQFYSAGDPMDPVSFTIGANSTSSGGGGTVASFQKQEKWTPPATPPASTGIVGDPDELSNVHAGQEITVWADGFQPDEQDVKVVVYSEPLVLDEHAVADSTGRVTWTGILPASLEPGKHTITFQGSITVGLVLDVKAPRQLEGCTVLGASLTWGFKESFRSYISGSIAHGEWAVSDGATYETPSFGWANGTGIYDQETGAGLVEFTGSIRFTGHDGLLDTSVANPRLQFVDEDTAFLVLDVSGVTMEDAMAGNTGTPVVASGVPFVELDLSGGHVTLSDDGLTLTGSDVPTAITAQGFDAFPNYEEGTAFDPLSFTVTIGDDCTVDVPVVEAATPTPEVTSDEGPDLGWLWWGGLAVVLLAGTVAVVIIVRRRRANAHEQN